MTDYLFQDFESKSELNLEVCGLDRYVKHPSTGVLLLSYALNKEEPKLWAPHKEPFPAALEELLDDPFVKKVSWNAGFERHIYKFVLKRDISINEWLDPMIYARHCSMPGYLEAVSEIMGLEAGEAKYKWGNKKDPGEAQRLLRMFCEPVCEAREETLFGSEPAIFRNWETDPEDWKKFGEYCCTDLTAMRSLLRKLMKYPLPEIEMRGWYLDQAINERGIPTDPVLIQNALHIAEQTKYALELRMKKITGLDNPNSRDQLLAWAKKEHYPYNSMGKVWVQSAISGSDISDNCREVFLMRQQASKTSWAKFEAIQNIVSSDGRLRNQFSFLGSARAGRWAGRDVQMQNLSKPTKELEKNLDRAVELVRAGKYDLIKQEFSNEMDVVSGVVRASFRTPDGQMFDIADLSAIENRGIGWETNCAAILDVFRQGKDPYKDFATRLYKTPYEAVTKEQRTKSKPAVLGAGYRLSGGEEGVDKWNNPIKTGLWGYGLAMGIELTREESHNAVQIFREAYPQVVHAWYDLENAVMDVICGGHPATVCKVYFEMVDGVLVARLPSGRCLHYIEPRIDQMEFFGKMKPTITYMGQDSVTKQWIRISTHGGKLLENITQAIARDVLLHGMLLADEAGLEIVLHIHDEIGIVRGTESKLDELIRCMSAVPKWAPGLILGAAGFSSQYYKKD